jgi:small subunit ribosomal protein S16
MAVKLRLQRKGRKKAPFYHIVAADARAPRDGRFIEKIGTYNPLTVPATIELNRERAYYWISVGAQPTDTVNAILRFKGVGFYKHLMRGLKKGALTQEQVDAQMSAWLEQKDSKNAARRAKVAADKTATIAKLDGTPKAKLAPVVEAPVEAVAEETAAEEVAVAAEEVVAEATAEETAAPAAEEAAPEAAAEETTEA